MMNSILEALWKLLSQLGRWFLDLFLWLLEYVFELVNEFLDFLADLITGIIVEALEYIAPHIPSDVMPAIVSTYTWLEFIEDWVPVSFGLTLVVVYYSIKLFLTVCKFVLKFIPFI